MSMITLNSQLPLGCYHSVGVEIALHCLHYQTLPDYCCRVFLTLEQKPSPKFDKYGHNIN